MGTQLSHISAPQQGSIAFASAFPFLCSRSSILTIDCAPTLCAEAEALLQIHGRNELQEKSKSKLLLFLEQARAACSHFTLAPRVRQSSRGRASHVPDCHMSS